MAVHDLNRCSSRRTFIKLTACASAAAALGRSSKAVAAPSADMIDTRVISPQAAYYHGWSTVARRQNGQLLLAWSGGREGHVCPFGRVDYMTSDDEGQTWTWPRTLLDSAIDDRDAGVLETAKGSILVTTFSSLAYVSTLEKAMKTNNPGWPSARLEAWNAVHNRLPEAARTADLGQWMLRSTDGGRTWSARYPSIVNSPHGPTQLADGRLLYAGKELWTGSKRVGVCESVDDGESWRWLAEIPVRQGDHPNQYHELHAVEVSPGRVVCHIRNHNPAHEGETLQSESSDGGRTWSEPHAIGVWGLPSHLLRRSNGSLLMTYGYRRAPYGNQARLSTDGGRSWSEPITLSADGAGTDLGYPSTVELGDGRLLTVWYEVMKGSSKAVLRQARWRLAE